ncbi:MAG TPA: hypothetical protein VMF06_08795, partial [Candidatus Limnocylindria bacterium]|nr:hypothetical protein [Candidatus Limnocylindria bacterium]
MRRVPTVVTFGLGAFQANRKYALAASDPSIRGFPPMQSSYPHSRTLCGKPARFRGRGAEKHAAPGHPAAA